MNFLGSGVFWGLILILLGISIIIRIVFNVNIPVFRIIIGLLLIYFGLQVLFGISIRSRKPRSSRQNINQTSRVLQKGNEYNIVFGGGSIDLSEWKDIVKDTEIAVNVVFGTAVIWIDPDMPVNIVNNTVFGETILPGRTISFIGKEEMSIGKANGDENTLFLEISTVFGSVEMKKKVS